MKNIIDNTKKNYFIKLAFVIFIVKMIISFYNSISLDSIDVLFNGFINNLYDFFVLYALGIVISKGEKNEK